MRKGCWGSTAVWLGQYELHVFELQENQHGIEPYQLHDSGKKRAEPQASEGAHVGSDDLSSTG